MLKKTLNPSVLVAKLLCSWSDITASKSSKLTRPDTTGHCPADLQNKPSKLLPPHRLPTPPAHSPTKFRHVPTRQIETIPINLRTTGSKIPRGNPLCSFCPPLYFQLCSHLKLLSILLLSRHPWILLQKIQKPLDWNYLTHMPTKSTNLLPFVPYGSPAFVI